MTHRTASHTQPHRGSGGLPSKAATPPVAAAPLAALEGDLASETNLHVWGGQQPLANPLPDRDRKDATTRLLRDLAPVFRLDPSRVELRWDKEARRVTESHHAKGLMDRGRILLHPDHHRPLTPQGRYLVAHEIAHLVQRQEAQPHPGSARPDPAAAEREADALGRAFADRQRLHRPIEVLPAGATAARAIAEPELSTTQKAQQLTEAVAIVYRSELAEIRDRLDTGFFDWAVTDGDVEAVLTVLAAFPWVTARALVGALTASERWTLADNVDDSHWKLFRPQILAAYCALSDRHKEKLSRSHFVGMAFHGFSNEEHFALREVLRGRDRLREDVGRLARTPRDREAWVELTGTEPDAAEIWYDQDARLTEALEAVQREKEVRQARELRASQTDLVARLKRWKEILNGWIVTDAEALGVLDEIGAYLPEPGAVESIGHALEQAGLLEDLLENIPADQIYEHPLTQTSSGRPPDRRKVVLRLASARPPHRNLELAKDLLSYGLLDWAITDEDAFIAFQLVKSLPAGSQSVFFAASEGKYAVRLYAHMSQSMREGATMNFYTGGQDQRDLKSIQIQLLDDAVWLPQQAENQPRFGKLQALIRMAIAAGEHEWVFEQSRRRYPALREAGLYENGSEFLEQIIDKFRLYRSRGTDADGNTYLRERYEPEVLEGTSLGDEVLEAIGHIPILGSAIGFLPYLAEIIGFLWHSDGWRILGSLFTESIGGQRLNLYEMQDLLGGNFFGARLKPATRRRRGRRGGRDAAAGETAVNFAAARWDLVRGVLEAEVQELAIAAIHYPLETMKFQTGEGSATGLKVNLGYPTPANHQAPFVDVSIQSLRLADVLLTFPEAMQTLNEVSIDHLVLRMGARTTDFDRLPKPSGKFDFGALLILPILGKFVSIPVLSRGRPTVPEAGEQMTAGLLAPELPMDLTVAAGRTVLRGLATSSGQYIASIEIQDLSLRGGESLESYRIALEKTLAEYDARLEHITTDLARAASADAHFALEERRRRVSQVRDHLAQELANARANEAELAVLRAKPESDLTPADKVRLRELRGGVLLDIGELHVRGLEGLVTLGELHLTDVHGQGTSMAGALSLLTPNETLARLLKGETYRPAILGRNREANEFSLDLGTFQTGPVAVREAIPTLREVDQALERLRIKIEQNPRDASLVEQRLRLEARREKVARFESLQARGIDRLNRTEEQELVRLRRELMEGSGISVESIAARGATLELGPISSQPTRDGSDTEAVDASRIERAGLSADFLEVKGIRLPEQGLEVGLIRGERMNLQYQRDVDGGRLRATGDRVTIEGVARSTSRELLSREREVLFEQVRLRAPVALHLPPDQIETLLREAVAIRRELGQAYAQQHLAQAEGQPNPDADDKVRELERRLELWRKQAGYDALKQDYARLGQAYAQQHLAQTEGRESEGLDEQIRVLEARLRPIESWLQSLDPGDIDLSHEIVGLQIALPARRRLVEIDAMLVELASLEEHLHQAETTLQQARDANRPTAEAEQDVAFLQQCLDQWHRRLVVGGLVGEGLDLSITGLGNIFEENYDFAARFREGLGIEGGEGDTASREARTPWARKLVITQSRLPGLEAERIEVGNLRGRFHSSRDRIRFDGLGFESLTLDRVEYHGWPHHLFSGGASTIRDLELTGEITMATRVNDLGEEEWAPTGIHIESLIIGRIEGDRLGYFHNDYNLHVEVQDGAVGGVKVTDSHIDLAGPKPKFDVHAEIGSMEQLQLVALVGQSLTARGTLDGETVTISYLDDGERMLLTADVAQASLTDGDLSFGSSRIRGSIRNLSGGVTLDETGLLQLRDIRIEQVRLGRSQLIIPGTQVYIDDGANVRGIRLDARVKLKKQGDKTTLERIQVSRFSFDQGVLEGLRVRVAGQEADPQRGTAASDPVAIDLARGEVHDFFLTGDNLLERQLSADIRGDYSIRDLNLRVGEEGRESLKLGLTVEGSALGGSLFGPDLTVIDLGTITRISGSFEGYGITTQFNTAEDFRLTGGVTLGKDFISITSLDTEGRFHLSDTTYRRDDGTQVKLEGADLRGIHLGRLKLQFGKVTENGTEVETVTDVTVEDLVLDSVEAAKFSYYGESWSLDDQGNEVFAYTTVRAQRAHLTDLRLENLTLDLNPTNPVYTLKLSNLAQANITGLNVVMSQIVNDEQTMTEVLTDLDARNLKANLTFSTVQTEPGKDWTSIEGVFHLDELGLRHPSITYTRPDGSEVKVVGQPGAARNLVVTGADVTFNSNGTMLIDIDQISGRNLQVTADGVNVEIPSVDITNALLGLKGLGLEEGIQILGAKADELSVGGLKVKITVDTTTRSDDPEADDRPPPRIVAEPLGGAEGTVFFEYRISPSWLALGSFGVEQGVVDIDSIDPLIKWSELPGTEFEGGLGGAAGRGVSYVGTGAAYLLAGLILEHDGLNLDIPANINPNLVGSIFAGGPGMHPERGDAGQIDLREMVEGINQGESEESDADSDSGGGLAALNALKIDAYRLALGNGIIGTSDYIVNLADAENGKNVLSIHSPTSVGQELTIASPEIFSDRAHFDLGDLKGYRENLLETGDSRFVNVKVTVTGLANTVFNVALEIEQSTIRDIRFGDVQVLSADALKQLPGPPLVCQPTLAGGDEPQVCEPEP